MSVKEKEIPVMTEFLESCFSQFKASMSSSTVSGLMPQLLIKLNDDQVEMLVFDPSFLATGESKTDLAKTVRDILAQRKGTIKEYAFLTEAWNAKSDAVPERWMRLISHGLMQISDLPQPYKQECVMLQYTKMQTEDTQERWIAMTPFTRFPDGSIQDWSEPDWMKTEGASAFQGRFADLT
jgi:hypothetical protein